MILISSIGEVVGGFMLCSAYLKMMRQVGAYSKKNGMQNVWLLSTQPTSIVRSYKQLPNSETNLLKYKSGWALLAASLIGSLFF